MKVIIAGSRWIWDKEVVYQAIASSGLEITEVVSGGNRAWCMEAKRQIGVDGFGEDWAKANNIPIKQFLPKWNLYGRGAGPRRNEQMAEYGEALILVWDGVSHGSADMRARAIKKGITIFEVVVEMGS